MNYQFTINLVEKQKQKIEVKTKVKDSNRNFKKEVLSFYYHRASMNLMNAFPAVCR